MASDLTFYLLAITAVICILISAVIARKGRTTHRLPPGPKPLPIVGNITSLPSSDQPEYRHWLTFKDAWGPISSVTVLGKTLILVHSASIAAELLDKRASIYSERPGMFFASKMVGWESHISFQGNNATMRSYRRDMHGLVGTKTAVDRYATLQDTEVRRFLVSTSKDPKGWEAYLKKVPATIILSMSFGYRAEPVGEDPMVTLIEQAMADFSDSTTAGKWLVDLLPWIRHFPEWLPGMDFRKIARGYRQVSEAATEVPMKFAEDRLAEGLSRPCMVADLLQGKGIPSAEEHQRIRISATDLYLAGSDTTFAALRWFFLAMCLNHSVQQKAQEELDSVIGRDRLPGFADRDNLPYIEAIWKETLRWNTVAPLSIPHAAQQDDEIQGYHIPKDAIIIPNTWWFLNDPSTYRSPSLFLPERFLGPTPEPPPDKMGAFGYGRRVCTGRALAEQTGWLLIAQTLSVFRVLPAGDETSTTSSCGKQRPAGGDDGEVIGTGGIIHHPPPFEMGIEVRGDEAREVLEKAGGGLSWEEGDSRLVDVVLPPVS